MKYKMCRKGEGMTNIIRDNRGVAVLYSLVIGIVVTVFSVMLLLAAYSLFAQSNENLGQVQCRVMAQSYAECLRNELSDQESTVYKYICECVEGKNGSKWVTKSLITPGVAPTPEVSELSIGLEQGNYVITTVMTYTGGSSIEEDDDMEDLPDDNDPEDGALSPSPVVSPTISPMVSPSVAGNEIEITARITCSKGGIGGVDEQSYTVTQKYMVVIK